MSYALPGTSWQIRGYNNGTGGVVSVGATARLHLTFTAEGAVSGRSGCNGIRGGYGVDNNEITVSAMTATRKLCRGKEFMERESAFF